MFPQWYKKERCQWARIIFRFRAIRRLFLGAVLSQLENIAAHGCELCVLTQSLVLFKKTRVKPLLDASPNNVRLTVRDVMYFTWIGGNVSKKAIWCHFNQVWSKHSEN
ncbi:hypothetical protein NPIL_663831 [Nephila pilipes]|uniref:Uncharacterized protein n=1 Tax=Nephila pilipes TaxID=299642 RepID=A0A8X6UIU7_NEPPI|nr:hypothetical protein NPIL_663831 [Nephila pilipes]